MTQERYQEAAEWLESMIAGHKHGISKSTSDAWSAVHAERVARYELLRDVVAKLASGFVIVPGDPVASLHVTSGSMCVTIAPRTLALAPVYPSGDYYLYAAAPDAGETT